MDTHVNTEDAPQQEASVAGGTPRITTRLPELAPDWSRAAQNHTIAPRKHGRQRPSLVTLGLAATLALGMFLGGAGAEATTLLAGNTSGATTATTAVISAAQPVADVGSASIGAIYKQVAPSVVLIHVTIQSSGRFSAAGEASGSGIVVDTQGDILTNNHVIASATSIQVELTDGSAHAATVVGSSPQNDLAVIKAAIPADKAPAAILGDSATAQVGDEVIAIGYPYGLGESVTSGIISGLNRDSAADQNNQALNGLMQVDAAINPGNSGGALVNSAGQIIGISTMIESPVDGFTGVGLVIPIDQARALLPQLEQGL